MIKSSRNILILVSVFIVLILTPFILEFNGNEISNRTADWSNFANYFTSLVSVVVGFLSLLLTAGIAKSVNKLSKNQHLSQLRYDSLKDFRKEIMLAFEGLITSLDKSQAIDRYVSILDGFIFHQEKLFPKQPSFHISVRVILESLRNNFNQKEIAHLFITQSLMISLLYDSIIE